jgi:hypothetical protein
VLYGVSDPEQTLENAITSRLPRPLPQSDIAFDRAIDNYFGMVEVAGQVYHTSEVLFAADDIAYREIGTRLCNESAIGKNAKPEGNHDH